MKLAHVCNLLAFCINISKQNANKNLNKLLKQQQLCSFN